MRESDLRPSTARERWSTYWSSLILLAGSQSVPAFRYVTSFVGHQPAARSQCMWNELSIRVAEDHAASPRGRPSGRGHWYITVVCGSHTHERAKDSSVVGFLTTTSRARQVATKSSTG